MSKVLHDLLVTSFSVDELRALAVTIDEALAPDLPNGAVNLNLFAFELVGALRRRGLVARALFDRLREVRPGLRDAIDAAERACPALGPGATPRYHAFPPWRHDARIPERLMGALRRQLDPDLPEGHARVVSLEGPPGSGKTRLAQKYTYYYKYEYQIINWVALCDRVSLSEEVQASARLLPAPPDGGRPAGRPWRVLFVIDGADEGLLPDALSGLPQSALWHVIICARGPVVLGDLVRLDLTLRSDEAVALLRRPGDDDPVAPEERALCAALGHEPWALAQAGPQLILGLHDPRSLLGLIEDGGFPAYSAHRESDPDWIFRQLEARIGRTPRVGGDVGLRAPVQAARDLVTLLAWFGPGPVPTRLVSEAYELLIAREITPLEQNCLLNLLLRQRLLVRYGRGVEVPRSYRWHLREADSSTARRQAALSALLTYLRRERARGPVSAGPLSADDELATHVRAALGKPFDGVRTESQTKTLQRWIGLRPARGRR